MPGAATPYPYGGKLRQIQVDLDLPKLQAYGLSPVDIVNAVNAQNIILPAGTMKLGPLEYDVEMNGTPQTIAELNDLPVKTTNGSTLYMRDVAHIRDGFAPQTNIVRQDGNRGALMSIYKNGSASTLQIVAGIKGIVQQAAQSLPPELKVASLVRSVAFRARVDLRRRARGLIAAALTACMILALSGRLASDDRHFDFDSALDLCVDHFAGRDRPDHQHHDAGGTWRSPSAFWSMTLRWKSRTSSAIWRWAKRCARRFWTEHNRLRCRPLSRRSAFASCSFRCSF